jgi:pyruvate dehydrogenase E1 component alpha subunit
LAGGNDRRGGRDGLASDEPREAGVADKADGRKDGKGKAADSERAGWLKECYEAMVLIRLFEEETERQYKRARVGGYCHLSSGQEAANVGAARALQDDDVLFTGYRSHGLALARGLPPGEVMAELFGREDGSAHGRGGSMHIADPDHGYLGGWGIVAGQLPLATGAAFQMAQEDVPQGVMVELGEGAVNMGAWHESLNLAGIWDLPIVYLVLNNTYGMGTTVDKASAEPEVHKRACAFRLHGERVDGQDLEEVHEAADRLMTRARDERKPAVLECMTYRFRGHSVADAGTAYRTREEIKEWREKRDPITLFGTSLLERGVLSSQDEVDEIRERTEATVKEAVEFAEGSPEPAVSSLARHVYGDPDTPEQFARMGPGSPFGERTLVLGEELGRS